MADYFTKFSLILELPNEAAQMHALALAHQAHRIQQDDEPPGDFPASLAEFVEDWAFETDAETDGWGIWIHSEYGGIDAVCAFIQHLLLTFDTGGRLTFEWSQDCSKPRVDAYGGGAAIITAEEIQTICTAQWLEQHTSDSVL